MPKRRIILLPPANVWRHLRNITGSATTVTADIACLWGLLLLKPFYGDVASPLGWLVFLLNFYHTDLQGHASVLD